MAKANQRLVDFMDGLRKRNPGEEEFHQAVLEVASTLLPFLQANPIYEEMQILERMTEPDRTVSFRVCWEDDQGHVRVNRGFRIQFNNSIGPYKGVAGSTRPSPRACSSSSVSSSNSKTP